MTSPKNDTLANSNGDLTSDQLAEIWAKRAYELAQEPPPPATGQTLELLVFYLGDERYGLNVKKVREIYPLEQLTPVPRTPSFVAGVFSARGRIISVVDLRTFMGLSPTEQTEQTKIVVVSNAENETNTQQIEIGILADMVEDVITIFKEDIEAPLTTHSNAQSLYLLGITADSLVVLNLEQLLNDERLIVHEEIR